MWYDFSSSDQNPQCLCHCKLSPNHSEMRRWWRCLKAVHGLWRYGNSRYCPPTTGVPFSNLRLRSSDCQNRLWRFWGLGFGMLKSSIIKLSIHDPRERWDDFSYHTGYLSYCRKALCQKSATSFLNFSGFLRGQCDSHGDRVDKKA